MIKIGDTAPVFNLHNQDGKLHTLEQIKASGLFYISIQRMRRQVVQKKPALFLTT